MSAPPTLPTAYWRITGIIVELRELKSRKNEDWRGYIAKVASLGATFELQLRREDFANVAEGQYLAFRGRFDQQGEYQRFIVEQIADPMKAEAGKGAA